MAKKNKIQKINSVMDYDEEKQKAVITQYETIRQTGVCNMFDVMCVARVSKKVNYFSLHAVASDIELYKSLLLNFGKLMKKFNIIQPARKK